MPIYKKPEDKAVETVTIRLTGDERRMLDHLAALDRLSLTDFIRQRIARRAEELNVQAPPERKERRRPGRPKMKRPLPESAEPISVATETVFESVVAGPDPLPTSAAVASSVVFPPDEVSDVPAAPRTPSVVPPMPSHTVLTQTLYNRVPETAAPAMFGDLVVRFRNSFLHRAEGTKRELEETISFLCSEASGAPIVSPRLLLSDLTSERLATIRDAIRDSDVRLAKKNLYLTYLRMMLHFAVKEPDIDLRINPSRELPPFSIVESDERRRFFIGQNE